jgi:hypothetical protein
LPHPTTDCASPDVRCTASSLLPDGSLDFKLEPPRSVPVGATAPSTWRCEIVAIAVPRSL